MMGEKAADTGLWRSILDDTLAKEARARKSKNLLILGMRACILNRDALGKATVLM